MPLALGSVIPQIFSNREDFPVLCDPITAIIGISMSIETLWSWLQLGRLTELFCSAYPVP